MSIPSESFNLENGHDIKTNSLFFLVHQTHGGGSKCNPKGDIIEKNNNTVISNKNEDKGNFEPFKKRQKMNKDPKDIPCEIHGSARKSLGYPSQGL